MKLALVSIEKQGFVRVATLGNLTAGDVDPNGKNPLETILGQMWSHNRVMLDCSKTAYVDSCAVGWIIATNRALREGGGKLVLFAIQPAVRQILDVLKIGKAVTLVDTESSALAAI